MKNNELTPIEQALQRLDTINQARFMYCYLEMSALAISKEIGINVKTVCAWRDIHKWSKKSQFEFSNSQIVALLIDINKVENTELRLSLLTNLLKGGKL